MGRDAHATIWLHASLRFRHGESAPMAKILRSRDREGEDGPTKFENSTRSLTLAALYAPVPIAAALERRRLPVSESQPRISAIQTLERLTSCRLDAGKHRLRTLTGTVAMSVRRLMGRSGGWSPGGPYGKHFQAAPEASPNNPVLAVRHARRTDRRFAASRAPHQSLPALISVQYAFRAFTLCLNHSTYLKPLAFWVGSFYDYGFSIHQPETLSGKTDVPTQ